MAAPPTPEQPFVPPTGTPPNYSPPGQPAPIDKYNYSPAPDGAYSLDPPGAQAPHEQHQVSSDKPLSLEQLKDAVDEIKQLLDAVSAGGAPPADDAGGPEPPVAPGPVGKAA